MAKIQELFKEKATFCRISWCARSVKVHNWSPLRIITLFLLVLDSWFVYLISKFHPKTMSRVPFPGILEGLFRQDSRERVGIWWRYVHKKTDFVHKKIINQITSSSKFVPMRTNVLLTRKMDPRSPCMRIKGIRVMRLIISSNAVKKTCLTLEITNLVIVLVFIIISTQRLKMDLHRQHCNITF